jgi:hypothetical protein
MRCSRSREDFDRLLIPLDRFEPTGTFLVRAPIRLYQTVVWPNTCLGIDAPIMVIAGRLSVRIIGCLRKLAFPDKGRTQIGIAAIKPLGMIEDRSLLHGCTVLG